tara:strand:- start:403 stop:561 length:159 start_codon:yes stop_codon:yes gene_type:complete
VKTPADQKSEGVLFHQLQPVISQTSPKASNIHALLDNHLVITINVNPVEALH